MKKTYDFSQTDVDAIITALKALPSFDFITSDTANIAFLLSASAGQKLIMQEPLSERERQFIILAVDSAYKALRQELDVDADTIKKLSPYLFTYNKLQSVFSVFD